MEANNFIAQLKADDTENDICDLRKVSEEYKTILTKLPTKDRGAFALNVFRILCRNLDKAPLWLNRINLQTLLTLSVDCVRETRALDREDRVKTLACIYHIHRHTVRQNKPVPPELVLKISFMPFEVDSQHLLQEYYKTYWNILADRLTYIERLKSKVNIIKLLPKFTEDVSKVIEIYDTVQFCSSILVFLIKKLHFLFNETHAKELSQTFVQIYSKLSMKDDLKQFKQLTEQLNFEIYLKLSDCLYVIAENASKLHFKDCNLDAIVRTCISFVGHSPDLFHCLQTFYQNSFCCILTANTNLTYTETVLSALKNSSETTEKLGYKKAMIATYPFLNQLLRLYIEYNVANCSTRPWKNHFNIEIQENCLKLILFFMRKLRNCEQLLKCDNCKIKTGLHDSIRLSLLIKHFITVSLSQNILVTNILDIFYTIVIEQYTILTDLNNLKCANYQKLFRKLQTDVHNTAITLNKAQHYQFSIKLFDIYLLNELKCFETEHKNISRVLYNKSICELDCKLYEQALIDAFLSLVFSQQEGLNTEKYMSLVMDVKAKELKTKASIDEEVETDTMQLVSVLDACEMALDKNLYCDLEPFMVELKFSVLLKHEFLMYAKLWPSIAPIAGVWRAALRLTAGDEAAWVSVENEKVLLDTLYEIILETPSAVRTVHSEYFSTIVAELLNKFDRDTKLTPDEKLVHAALLFLQFEYDLAAASLKYKWKSNEPIQSPDPEQSPAPRTIPQEHAVAARAIVAVRLLAQLSPTIQLASKAYLRPALQLYQVFVPQLLLLSRDVEGLQLAYICCQVADIVGDDESYLRNAGVVVSSCPASPALECVLREAGGRGARAGAGADLVFICDLALHYWSSGAGGAAARLARVAQSRVLRTSGLQPDCTLDLAVGRLLDVQAVLCTEGPSVLTAVNAAHRHYLSIASSGTRWSRRRLRSLCARRGACLAARAAARAPRALRLWRRARAAATPPAPAAAPPAAPAALACADVVDVACFDDAQIKIDNRLKHFLGLQPSNETQPHYGPEATAKQDHITRKPELEIMLENMVLKKLQTSPSLPCMTVPAFKTPEFFKHSSKCCCYACEIPVCLVLACKTSGLEAAMYSRANEIEIAGNYFDGVLEMMSIADRKLREISKKQKEIFEDFIVDSVEKNYQSELKMTQLDALMELAFFELKNKNYDLSDEYIVRIHEVVQEIGSVDKYITCDILNLMTASAHLKKAVRKPEEVDLEAEFESLRLSPVKELEPPKTPITKPSKLPIAATKLVVKDEELPKKRKVIKLNLDDGSSDEKDFEKPTTRSRRGIIKKAEFKVPNPITSKPVLEIATPRPQKPKIIITQPSLDVETPKPLNKTKSEFFTPSDATPDQFFTPMTSIKTYSKKSLRQNIVKNLEHEFSTPKAHSIDKMEKIIEKENKVGNIETDTLGVSQKCKTKKKMLVRATSPGKLCKEKKDKCTRTRRLRQHVNFSLDEDDKK